MQPPCRKKGRFLLHGQRHNNLQEVIGGGGVRAGEPCAGGEGEGVRFVPIMARPLRY